MKRYIEIRGILPQNDERMIMTGIPKFDALISCGFSKDKVLEKFGLNPALPAILYAPTHTKNSSVYLL